MKVENRIGQDFSTFGLFKFALPAFFTNVFSQIFKTLDDALFISRFVGEKALAGLNLLSPLNSVQFAFSNLCALGAGTISAQFMGEGKQKEAKQVFSKIIVGTIIMGAIFSLLINIFTNPILAFLGADEELYNYAIWQIRLVFSITPLTFLNAVFSLYYSTAGKPKVGMICSVVNGVLNIGLDLVLITILKMGVLGAAIATATGEIVTFFIGLFFFTNKNNEIYFVKPEKEIIHTCLRCFKFAIPQCVNSLSFGVTNYITNIQLLRIVGSNGVAANAIINDIRSILATGLVGMAASLGPVVAYKFGEKNVDKLRKTLFSIVKIWAISSISLITIGFILRTPLINVFMSDNSSQEFYDMSLFGTTIEIFAIPFLSGCFTSSRMFIALNNAKTATLISIFRNLIFRSASLIILPNLFGVNGVWFAIPFGEFIAFNFVCVLIYLNRNNYGYGKNKVALMMNN